MRFRCMRGTDRGRWRYAPWSISPRTCISALSVCSARYRVRLYSWRPQHRAQKEVILESTAIGTVVWPSDRAAEHSAGDLASRGLFLRQQQRTTKRRREASPIAAGHNRLRCTGRYWHLEHDSPLWLGLEQSAHLCVRLRKQSTTRALASRVNVFDGPFRPDRNR